MKKSLLALAALTAFAGAASAQSSVTLYGRVDLSVGKGPGVEQKGMFNGSGSRLGFRGVEDLGGGMSALFNIEHRFNADTGESQNFNLGAAKTNNRFWGARSFVGLQGGFGQVVLGREYTTSFLMNQLLADPWGWDTVVSGSNGVGLGNTITGGAIAKVRNDSSITYKIGGGGFNFGVQVAEATDTINNFQKKPVNFAVNYAGGPLFASFGYEKTGEEGVASAKWMSFNATYNFGMAKVGAFFGKGTTAADNDHQSWMITATAPIGAGEARFLYGKLRNKTADIDATKGFGLGYHYSLSKRTTLYADVVRNTGVLVGGDNETGYDIGIKHNF